MSPSTASATGVQKSQLSSAATEILALADSLKLRYSDVYTVVVALREREEEQVQRFVAENVESRQCA